MVDIPGLPYDGVTDVVDQSGNGKGVALNVWPSDNRIPCAEDPIPLDTFVLSTGELAYALTSQRLRVGDGYTPGGEEVAYTSDLDQLQQDLLNWTAAVAAALNEKANLNDDNTFNGEQTFNGDVTFNGDTNFAQPIEVPDEVYSSAWDGNLSVPSKNALWDKIETLATDAELTAGLALKANLTGGNAFTGNQVVTGYVTVTDEAYGAPWSGKLEVPTKNAVYDKIQAVVASIPTTIVGITGTKAEYNTSLTDDNFAYVGTGNVFTANQQVSLANPTITLNPVSGTSGVDIRGTASTNDGMRLTATGASGSILCDSLLFKNRADSVTFGTLNDTNLTMTVPVIVPDEAYGASWDGKMEAPTKNAVYDKIQALGSVSVSDEPYGATWDGVTGAAPSKNAVYDKIQAMSVGGTGVTTFNGRSGTVSLLEADVTAAMPAGTGDVTNPAGSVVNTIAPKAVSLGKMADVGSGTVFYRKTAGNGAPETQTLATLKTDLNLTGTNSGDQTSIVGITGTKAQFDAALTDGDFAYAGAVVTSFNTRTGAVTLTGADVNTALGYTAANNADLSGKANLAGGNAFTGNQSVGGQLTTTGLIAATGDVITNGQFFSVKDYANVQLLSAWGGKGWRFASEVTTAAAGALAIQYSSDGFASNFVDTLKLDSTGNITAGGTLTVQSASGSAQGRIGLIPGDGSNSGYVAFYAPGGTRVGYMGYADAINLSIVPEGGRSLFVSGNMTAGGTISTTGGAAGIYVNDRDGSGTFLIYNNNNLLRFHDGATGDKMSLSAAGDLSAGGSIIAANNLTAGNRMIGKELIIQGSAAEGGQIVLGYKGMTSITTGDIKTWNIDVTDTDQLRAYRIDAAGAAGEAFTINPTNLHFVSRANVYAQTDRRCYQQGTPGVGPGAEIYMSTGAPSSGDGNNGDIWMQYA